MINVIWLPMKNELFNPCCEKFKKLAIAYEDISSELDRPIRMLCDLLIYTQRHDTLSEETLEAIGLFVRDMLNR